MVLIIKETYKFWLKNFFYFFFFLLEFSLFSLLFCALLSHDFDSSFVIFYCCLLAVVLFILNAEIIIEVVSKTLWPKEQKRSDFLNNCKIFGIVGILTICAALVFWLNAYVPNFLSAGYAVVFRLICFFILAYVLTHITLYIPQLADRGSIVKLNPSPFGTWAWASVVIYAPGLLVGYLGFDIYLSVILYGLFLPVPYIFSTLYYQKNRIEPI